MFREVIVNLETNEIIEQEMPSEIIAEIQAMEAQAEIDRSKAEQEQAKKESARKAILQKIGLTEEEAKLLLS